MEINCPSLLEFKQLIENWHLNKGLNVDLLIYDLFMDEYERNFKNQDLLEKASEILEILKEKFEKEWKSKWWTPFQNFCISYLLKEAGIQTEKIQKYITERLTPLSAHKKIYLHLTENIHQIENYKEQEELTYFTKNFTNHIKLYNNKLLELNKKYMLYKRTFYLWIFQFIATTQEFTIARHLFKTFDIKDGMNWLFAPSHAHYLIDPKETTSMIVRVSLGAGGGAIGLKQNSKRVKTTYT